METWELIDKSKLGAPGHIEGEGDEGGDGDEAHSFRPPAYLFILLILFVESYRTYGPMDHSLALHTLSPPLVL